MPHDAYASWKSPIPAQSIVADSLGLGQVVIDGAEIYWSEMRPIERGRNAIMRQRGAQAADMLPAPYRRRSRVHEYGGGAFCVDDGVLYFCNDADQRIYRAANGDPAALSAESQRRYADLIVDRTRRRLIAVGEDHGGAPVQNSLVAIDIDGNGHAHTLAAGADFF